MIVENQLGYPSISSTTFVSLGVPFSYILQTLFLSNKKMRVNYMILISFIIAYFSNVFGIFGS